jgi:hypothetical protein
MKRILNTKVHPAIIIVFGSVLFWFLLVFVIYLLLMVYWIHKMFFTPDNVHGSEVFTTYVSHLTARTIWRKCHLGFYFNKLNPLGKK